MSDQRAHETETMTDAYAKLGTMLRILPVELTFNAEALTITATVPALGRTVTILPTSAHITDPEEAAEYHLFLILIDGDMITDVRGRMLADKAAAAITSACINTE